MDSSVCARRDVHLPAEECHFERYRNPGNWHMPSSHCHSPTAAGRYSGHCSTDVHTIGADAQTPRSVDIAEDVQTRPSVQTVTSGRTVSHGLAQEASHAPSMHATSGAHRPTSRAAALFRQSVATLHSCPPQAGTTTNAHNATANRRRGQLTKAYATSESSPLAKTYPHHTHEERVRRMRPTEPGYQTSTKE